MTPSVIWLLITVVSVETQSVQPPVSACPEYFKYRFDRTWTGQVSVPIVGCDLPIRTKVSLSIRAVLRTKYVGLIELSDPPEFVLDTLERGTSKRVNYTIRFPLPAPLPTLNSIVVNNVTICHGDLSIGPVVTRITLEHEFPTNKKYLSANDHTHIGAKDEGCGKSSKRDQSGTYQLTGHGEWPWLVAIMIVRGRTRLEFQCSGSLLTKKHVITAAHCISNERDGFMSPKDFLLYFGKHDLTRWGESNSQTRKISKLIVHPDFTSRVYHADIGIMVLADEVQLNQFVRPVCLWSGETLLYPYIGQLGTVVGWGKNPDTNTINAEPRMFKLPIADQEECLRSRQDFIYLTSERTLCAGLRNGTGPCNGDSGSGLMLPIRFSEGEIKWELRGIISLSLLDPFKQTCDLSNYLVFTDVVKFSSWINQMIH